MRQAKEELSKLSPEELKEKLEEHKNGDIAIALKEIGFSIADKK